jgi:hypothetical protein
MFCSSLGSTLLFIKSTRIHPPILVGHQPPVPWNHYRDSTLMLLPAGRQQLWYGASVDMRKEVGTADFSVPFQILWLTIIYGARITGDIGY